MRNPGTPLAPETGRWAACLPREVEVGCQRLRLRHVSDCLRVLSTLKID